MDDSVTNSASRSFISTSALLVETGLVTKRAEQPLSWCGCTQPQGGTVLIFSAEVQECASGALEGESDRCKMQSVKPFPSPCGNAVRGAACLFQATVSPWLSRPPTPADTAAGEAGVRRGAGSSPIPPSASQVFSNSP